MRHRCAWETTTRPSSYFYKSWSYNHTLWVAKGAYNKPPNPRWMNYVYGDDLMAAKRLRAADWGVLRAASLATVAPGADVWGQGPDANWCRARRLWAKWENYTFGRESAAGKDSLAALGGEGGRTSEDIGELVHLGGFLFFFFKFQI